MIRGALVGTLLTLFASAALAQSYDDGSFSTAAFSDQGFYFGTSPPPPVNPICSHRNGVALACNGSIVSIYLADGQATTSGVKYIEGVAYSSDGRLYVTPRPSASGTTKYINGFAYRRDGVTIIATGGATRHIEGRAVNSNGETLVTESAPTKYINGVGTDREGRLSITEAN